MASTIKDIRTETGLALATISKYLNGGNVKAENREKIENAIKKLDYRPNEMARALITKKTRTIGFVVNDVASQFSGILLRYTGTLLNRAGYSMMICDSSHDLKLEEQNIRFCIDKKVDGVMMLPVSRNAEILRPLNEAGIPVILLDREMEGGAVDSVTIDNRAAAKRAVQYLMENGHRKIAVIHSEEYTGYERYLGYLDALREAGITPRKEYVHAGLMHSVELGYDAMRKLMALDVPPTAVMMSNYEVNLGVVMALNEGSWRCPEDISLVGFDELTLTMVMKPRMTVVTQPMENICQESVRLLLRRIEEETPGAAQRIMLTASFEEAESVRRITPAEAG